LTFPSHVPSLYAVIRGCYILSNLHYWGQYIRVSIREGHVAAAARGVKNDEDMG